jgi:hypothetical protein
MNKNQRLINICISGGILKKFHFFQIEKFQIKNQKEKKKQKIKHFFQK